jgi:hypothetical protein
MSASPDPDSSSSTDIPHYRTGAFARGGRIGGGVVVTWFVMFLAILVGGLGGFEEQHARPWAWPLVGAAGVLCGGFALLLRRRRPETAIGIWIGIGIGLLHAGLCFLGA